jgi:hypothetical protein
MPQPPPASLPPGCADCQTSVQPAQPPAPAPPPAPGAPAAPPAPGAPAAPPAPWKMLRSANGQTRLDFGNRSVISNPAAGETLVLDHVKKEAVSFPAAPAAPGAPPPIPSMSMPAVPGAPPPTVQNLGKKFIDGHEVEGKLFTIPPPPAPKAPSAPQMPPGPPIPQGKLPQAPLPSPPKAPTTVETWTSTQFHMPVLTTVTGSFGKQVSKCKCSSPGAPPPASMFQVPAGYKLTKKTQ